ncbi:MAG: host-nuclease inhibitor Gam family protein [Verrucomicrobiota bacterium]
MQSVANPNPVETPPLQSREDAQAAMAHYAEVAAQRDALSAQLAQEMARARARFEPRIAELTKSLDVQAERIKGWAVANRGAEFGGRKSMEFVAGYVGFRKATAALQLLEGWTWDMVLAKLTGPFKRYVRNNPEVNKLALKADAQRLGPRRFKLIGVRLVQDEKFYIELKPAVPETRP